jgi:hypothetical protein
MRYIAHYQVDINISIGYTNNQLSIIESTLYSSSCWGETGGHVLRLEFIKEAKRQALYVSSYVHRNVIQQRIKRGENIEIVQRYDPNNIETTIRRKESCLLRC